MVRQTSFRAISPAGLVINEISLEAGRMLISARPGAAGGVCPDCGFASIRVHSRYIRRLADLPAQNHVVRLNIEQLLKRDSVCPIASIAGKSKFPKKARLLKFLQIESALV